jgi:hypothetical protein
VKEKMHTYKNTEEIYRTIQYQSLSIELHRRQTFGLNFLYNFDYSSIIDLQSLEQNQLVHTKKSNEIIIK